MVISKDITVISKDITLEALSALSFLPHDIKDLVNEFGTLGIVWKTRVR